MKEIGFSHTVYVILKCITHIYYNLLRMWCLLRSEYANYEPSKCDNSDGSMLLLVLLL